MQTKFPTWKLILFAALSVCDFVITYLLISRSQGQVYESNPVADQWLQQGGWIGLAGFKAAIVLGVSVIAVYLYYRRPRIAHDLLAIACGALVVAVLTGTSIAVTNAEPNGEDGDDSMPRLVVRGHGQVAPKEASDYVIELEGCSYALAANRTDLTRAVAELKRTNRGSDPKWLESLRQAYPNMDERTLFACDLLQHTIGMRIRGPRVRELAERLEREFVAVYGVEPNLPYRQMLHLAPMKERANDSHAVATLAAQ
jgi:Domain of unknown function (DUF5658)